MVLPYITWFLFAASVVYGIGHAIIALALPVPYLLHAHYRSRVPALAASLIGGIAMVALTGFATWNWLVVGGQALFTLFGLRVHPRAIFRAVPKPSFEPDPAKSPLDASSSVVVLELEEEVHAYPLTYVAYHHIVNDRLGGRSVIVSFCPICNTAMSYDTTEIMDKRGFVVSGFLRGNMTMADLPTGTIWQQATGESLAGKLHPRALPQLYAQILPWQKAVEMFPGVKLVATTVKERRPFAIPTPGFWRWFLKSEIMPGLRHRDTRFPARTRVIGIPRIGGDLVYIKDEVARSGWLRNDDVRLLLAMAGETVSGFLTEVGGAPRKLAFKEEKIIDEDTGTTWNLRGQGVSGPLKKSPLTRWPVSDEFWFSWAEHHPLSQVVRVSL